MTEPSSRVSIHCCLDFSDPAVMKLLQSACSVPVHKLNDSNDPVELKEEVKQVFDDWIRLSDESPSEESHDSYVASLQKIGFLKVYSSPSHITEVLSRSLVESELQRRVGQRWKGRPGLVVADILAVKGHISFLALRDRAFVCYTNKFMSDPYSTCVCFLFSNLQLNVKLNSYTAKF
jgi:hypothetical protein